MKILSKGNNEIIIQYCDGNNNNLYNIEMFIKNENQTDILINLISIGYFFNGGGTKLIYCKEFIKCINNKKAKELEMFSLQELCIKLITLIAKEYLH